MVGEPSFFPAAEILDAKAVRNAAAAATVPVWGSGDPA